MSWQNRKKHRKKVMFGHQDTNCRPGHFYTFCSRKMFEIFMIHSWERKLKTLLFFKILIRCWDSRVQNYPTSARKIKKYQLSAWSLLYFLFIGAQKMANIFKEKRLTTASTFPYSSKNSSAEHIHAFYTCLCVHEWVSVCVCVCVCAWMSQCVSMWVCLCELVCL